MKLALVALTALTLAFSASDASADGFAGELNGAYTDKLWGGELGGSYRIGMGGFHLTPTVGALIYKSDNQRYQMSTFSNGQSRCRDITNGQFAKTALCREAAIAGYGRLEASYGFPGLEVGGGARIDSLSQKVQPYGTISTSLTPLMGLKANAGKNYYALGLTFNY